MIRNQLVLDVYDEIIVDNFAGGGGASHGIERALGRAVDIAVNHDPIAVALHKVNHPQTYHYCEDVFKVDPKKACKGRKVGLAWFSPDCKDFSKAKGGKPKSKKIRGLAWVVHRWAKLVRPRVIMLENVEEFQEWGPLDENGNRIEHKKGSTFDLWVGRLRNLGYVVEWRELRACDYGAPTIRKRLFLIARCDGRPIVWPKPTHGDPTSAEVIGGKLKPWRTAAECIDWSIPCPSIFLTREEGRKIGVNRPLADATMRRIARGLKKFVLEAQEPFIVQYADLTGMRQPYSFTVRGAATPSIIPLTHQGSDRVESIDEPFRTITGAHRGEKGIAMPYVAGVGGRMGQSPERSVNMPLQTLTAKADSVVVTPIISDANRPQEMRNHSADDPFRTMCAEVKGGHYQLVQAFLAKHYGNGVVGTDTKQPIGTITSVDHHSLVTAHMEAHYSQKGDETRAADIGGPMKTITGSPRHALMATHLTKQYGTTTGQMPGDPLHTVTGEGRKLGAVSAILTQYNGCSETHPVDAALNTITTKGRLGMVRAFLQQYYSGGGQDANLTDPMHTVTTKGRLGIVTVDGIDYQITDIGMRMLAPRELFRGQGFPETYVIDIYVDHENEKTGVITRKQITQEAQIRLCGNSVCPQMAEALAAANVPEMSAWKTGERRAWKRRIEELFTDRIGGLIEA